MKRQHKYKQLKPYLTLGSVSLFILLTWLTNITPPYPIQAAHVDLVDSPELSTLNNQLPFQATFVEAEDTSRVTYSSGWTTEPCIYCSGGQYRLADNSDKTATLIFEGVSISIVFVGNAHSGIAQITIDNVPYPSINLFNNATIRTVNDPVEYVIAANLSPGQHTLQVKVTGQNGYNYRTGWSARDVGLDGFRYGNFPFGAVQGRVLDPDGDGLSGAWLTLTSEAQTYTVPAAYDGVFSLSGLPGGVYNLTASLDDYTSQTVENVSVSAGSQTSGIDIILPEAAGHDLFGRIYLPHPNKAAIQQPGTTLVINVKQASNASGWSAALATPYNSISLPILSASFDPITAWTLQATIPPDTLAELYNLTVTSSLGSDTQLRAVQVVTQYRDPFYVVVLGDPQAATQQSGQPIFNQIVDEINLINPAFVIAVGDLMEQATPARYEDYLRAINRLQVPSYSIPGNHDFIDSTGVVEQWPLWKKYLGRRFYSFDYGSYHFVGMDNSMVAHIDPGLVDAGGYFADQATWAQADLAAHQNSLLRSLFLHITRQPSATGDALNLWRPAWIDNLQTNLVLYGHTGQEFVEITGATPVHWVETVDMINERYRLVRISNGALGSYTYNGHPKDSIPSGNLEVGFSPANNGNNNTVTATINNDLQEHFEHALLRFVMPKFGCYETDKGAVTQFVDSDNGQVTVVYVTLDVPANSNTEATLKRCPEANLAITSTVLPNPVIAGQSLTYTLTVANLGPSQATAVSVIDTLPAGVAFVSATPGNGCTETQGVVTCNLADLAVDGSTQVSIGTIVDPTIRGTLTNSATVTGNKPDSNPANNTTTTQTPVETQVDLIVSQEVSPNPVIAGESLTYTLGVVNNGPSQATAVSMIDTLPAGVTFISATPGSDCTETAGIVTCNLANLGPMDSQQVAIQVRVDPTTVETLTNSITVVDNEPDSNPANNTATAQTPVEAQADLVVSQTVMPDPGITGESLTYTLTIANHGPSQATNIILTDTLPAAIIYDSATSGQASCLKTENSVICNFENLASGANATTIIKLTSTAVGTLTNIVSVSSATPDPNPGNNTVSRDTMIKDAHDDPQPNEPLKMYLPLILK